MAFTIWVMRNLILLMGLSLISSDSHTPVNYFLLDFITWHMFGGFISDPYIFTVDLLWIRLQTRGLKNVIRLYVKKANGSEWEQVTIPASVRSIVALNLNNYASERNLWGNLKPEYLAKRGFVEAHVTDGLVEIFGLKHGWHASFVMTELISAIHIAQAAGIQFELRGGEWREGYLQMDGELWKQPMDKDYSTFLVIKRVQLQSVMLNGE